MSNIEPCIICKGTGYYRPFLGCPKQLPCPTCQPDHPLNLPAPQIKTPELPRWNVRVYVQNGFSEVYAISAKDSSAAEAWGRARGKALGIHPRGLKVSVVPQPKKPS